MTPVRLFFVICSVLLYFQYLVATVFDINYIQHVGLYSVTGPVYVSEMAPSHIRGKLGLVNYFMTGGGVLSASIAAGLFFIDSQHAYTFGWRFDNHK